MRIHELRKMKTFVVALSLLFIGVFTSDTATAAGTDENMSPIAVKTKKIVDTAYDYISKNSDDMEAVQNALRNDPRFYDHKMGLYVFVHCYNKAKKEAIVRGQGIRPELLGKNLWDLRTPSGRLLFQELVEQIEKKGYVWQEYEWLNPYTKSIQTKRSLFRGVLLKDGSKCWVGSGYWKKR
jgi:signal transduction histidine kinase